MALTAIHNNGNSAFPMPVPYVGAIPAGGYAVISDTQANVIANLGGDAVVRGCNLGLTDVTGVPGWAASYHATGVNAAFLSAVPVDGVTLDKAGAASTGLEVAPGAIGPAQLDDLVGAVVGDASDGTVTFDGTSTVLGLVPSSGVYTATRDLYLANGSMIDAAATLNMNGFRLFHAGLLTNNGVIAYDGNAASGATPGAAGNANGTVGAGTAGGAGASGSAVGSGATNLTQGISGGSAAGGAGGSAGANAGGAGGTFTALAAKYGGGRDLIAALTGAVFGNGSNLVLSGGAGGGGGAGDNADAVGGGGGAGGGVLLIVGYNLVNNGAIHARGGAGAAGTSTSHDAGGGGGGAGGLVRILARIYNGSGSIDANGGGGGAGVGTGTAGGAGSAGTVIRAAF